MANVRFYSGTKEQYLSLASHNPLALYFCEDTGEMYKGSICLTDGIRIVPTRADLPECPCAADGVVYFIAETKSGFMISPDRTEWLQTIYAPVTDAYAIPEEEMYTTVTTVGAVRDVEAKIYKRIEEVATSGLSALIPVDGTIKIADTTDGGKSIGVAIAPVAGNQLVAVDGGLFVPTVVVPEYTIEKVVTEEGFSASYKLKKTVDGEISYVGDTVNIAKDLVLQSASLETVTEDNVPYDGACVGDPYIKMVFNNVEASNLYIPVKGLVDTYTAGTGIRIENNVISVKLADTTHGLMAVDGALALNLATRKSDGAMSKEDKRIVDSIPYAYVARKFDISGTPVGTLVDYGDREIRIMCPANAEFVKQAVGIGGDPNTYYMTLRTYAPANAVGYKERLGDQADAEILTNISTDEYGRRYQSTWLGMAKFSEVTGAWTYYGANSTESKYIGWDYRIDWFDANNVVVESNSVRINLSNEDCHYSLKPYYLNATITSEEVESLQADIAEIKEVYTWSDM